MCHCKHNSLPPRSCQASSISAIKLLPSRPSSIMKIVACDPTYYFSAWKFSSDGKARRRHTFRNRLCRFHSNPMCDPFFLSNSRSIALRKRVIRSRRELRDGGAKVICPGDLGRPHLFPILFTLYILVAVNGGNLLQQLSPNLTNMVLIKTPNG